VLQAEQLPTSITHLNTTLTDMDTDGFAHWKTLKTEKVQNQ
jgi:hypothetical protein